MSKNNEFKSWLRFNESLIKTQQLPPNIEHQVSYLAVDLAIFLVVVSVAVILVTWRRRKSRIQRFFKHHGMTVSTFKDVVRRDGKGNETRHKVEVVYYPKCRVRGTYIEIWDVMTGINVAKLESLKEEFASVFQTHKIASVEELSKRSFGKTKYSYRLHFHRLPRSVSADEMPPLPPFGLWHGLDPHKNNVVSDARKVPTWGVFGPIRSGKSVIIRGMIESILISSPYKPQLIVIDEKGNDYSDLVRKHQGKRYGTTSDEEFERAAQAIESIVNEFDAFKAKLDTNDVQVESWHQLRETKSEIDVPPFYVLVCDELGQYAKEQLGETKSRKAIRERFLKGLGRLLALYRFAGILIILGTQESTKELEVSYTNLIGKIVGRQTEEMSRRIVGDKSATDPTLIEGKLYLITPYQKTVVRSPHFMLPAFDMTAAVAKLTAKGKGESE